MSSTLEDEEPEPEPECGLLEDEDPLDKGVFSEAGRGGLPGGGGGLYELVELEGSGLWYSLLLLVEFTDMGSGVSEYGGGASVGSSSLYPGFGIIFKVLII